MCCLFAVIQHHRHENHTIVEVRPGFFTQAANTVRFTKHWHIIESGIKIIVMMIPNIQDAIQYIGDEIDLSITNVARCSRKNDYFEVCRIRVISSNSTLQAKMNQNLNYFALEVTCIRTY